MTRENFEYAISAIFFIAVIAAHLLFGATATVRVVGAACVVTGLLWATKGSVPVGIEGKPPSFYLKGKGAMVAGVVMGAFGLALLLYSSQAACLLGWASGTGCS